MSETRKSRTKNEEILVLVLPRGEDTDDETVMEEFPEHAKLIGFIIAEWSQIEHKLAIWLGLRMAPEDAQMIRPMVYEIESSRGRLNAIHRALQTLIDASARERLTKLMDEAGRMLTLRNKYAHAHFGKDHDSKELAIAPLGKEREKRPTNLPLHELRDHFSKIRRFSNRVGVILAAELGVPLKGPDRPDTVPKHPLGLQPAHTRRAPPVRPKSSEKSRGAELIWGPHGVKEPKK